MTGKKLDESYETRIRRGLLKNIATTTMREGTRESYLCGKAIHVMWGKRIEMRDAGRCVKSARVGCPINFQIGHPEESRAQNIAQDCIYVPYIHARRCSFSHAALPKRRYVCRSTL